MLVYSLGRDIALQVNPGYPGYPVGPVLLGVTEETGCKERREKMELEDLEVLVGTLASLEQQEDQHTQTGKNAFSKTLTTEEIMVLSRYVIFSGKTDLYTTLCMMMSSLTFFQWKDK